MRNYWFVPWLFDLFQYKIMLVTEGVMADGRWQNGRIMAKKYSLTRKSFKKRKRKNKLMEQRYNYTFVFFYFPFLFFT